MNRACLHHDCHWSGGTHPQAVHKRVTNANGLGLIVSMFDDPAEVALQLPDGRIVWLNDGDQYLEEAA